MISDFFKVGEKVNVPGVKTPITITFVSDVTVYGEGKKGGRYGFVQNIYDNLVYCLTPKREKIIMDIITEPVDYTKDTTESKLKEYKGQDIISFLDDQIGYFCLKRANSLTDLELEHYQKQLDITGTALTLHVKGMI
jgi:hypothetical protein